MKRIFFLAVLCISLLGFSFDQNIDKIQKWILYAKDDSKKYPVTAVYLKEDDYELFKEGLKRHSHPKDYKEYQNNFRLLSVKWDDFSKEYFYLAPKANANMIEIYFFDRSGVALFSQTIEIGKGIPHSFFNKLWQAKEDFLRFQKTFQSRYSILHWPNMAFISNMPHLTIGWLKKIDYNQLTDKEKKGYDELMRLAIKS
ncbi:MAG: hypothetical protein OEZ13_03780 [Spirochaetia bacterium]|nr:hypothetical protein [Spirochaetia bacterium]